MMISLHGYVAARAEIGRPDTGGQVVYVLQLSQYLARHGFAVDIFTRRFDGQDEIELVAPGVRIVRIPAGGSELIRKEWMHEVVPEWVANAADWISKGQLTYPFIDSHYWDAGLAGDALGKALGVPHVHTPHSLGTWKRRSMDERPEELERQYNFRRRIHDEAVIMRNAALVVATSPQQRDLLAGRDYQLDPSRIAVVPPGYDDGRFNPVSPVRRQAIRRDFGFAGPTVLALGRVAANKGYDLLVRAMSVVLARAPEARLVLAVGSTQPTPGEARQVEELRALADSLGIGDKVAILDYIPDEQLADMYRAADVFALSSRYEPFGMTAVEAMACGTPAVITTQGGLWQMIRWGRDAICADPNDVQAFGDAIAALLSHAQMARQVATAGMERARRSFTWDRIARDVLAAVSAAAGPAVQAPRWAVTTGEAGGRRRAQAATGPTS